MVDMTGSKATESARGASLRAAICSESLWRRVFRSLPWSFFRELTMTGATMVALSYGSLAATINGSLIQASLLMALAFYWGVRMWKLNPPNTEVRGERHE